MRKRNLTTSMLLVLRHMGLLCKKPMPEIKRLRIARTVYPDHRLSSIESERSVWAENVKSVRKFCGFNIDTRICNKCNVNSIESFAVNCESANKKIKK